MQLHSSLTLLVSLACLSQTAFSAQSVLHDCVDDSCWPGKNIHDPCDGFTNGCTKDGILVACDGDPKTGSMIFQQWCEKCECVYGSSVCKQDTTKCWTGNIHDPCDGASTGCANGGTLVKCDSGHMIFSSNCGGGMGNGTCHCLASGESSC